MTNPLEAYMKQAAATMENQTKIAKKMAALELGALDSQIGVSEARAATKGAELASLELQRDNPSNDASTNAYLDALIDQVTIERDAHTNEAKALRDLIEITQKMAELTLGIDPGMLKKLLDFTSGGDIDG